MEVAANIEVTINMAHMKNFLISRVNNIKKLSRLKKTLLLVIMIKLFIMFVFLKLFFFKDHLGSRYKTESERANHVLENLTQTTK
jgi:flagellar biosynthesis/type III secretory pathway M-ring protein FliF/YscJ